MQYEIDARKASKDAARDVASQKYWHRLHISTIPNNMHTQDMTDHDGTNMFPKIRANMFTPSALIFGYNVHSAAGLLYPHTLRPLSTLGNDYCNSDLDVEKLLPENRASFFTFPCSS